MSGDPEHVRMFVREAMLAAEFKHPALAQVYEVGEEGGLYIARWSWCAASRSPR